MSIYLGRVVKQFRGGKKFYKGIYNGTPIVIFEVSRDPEVLHIRKFDDYKKYTAQENKTQSELEEKPRFGGAL